jgi:hypothetical protein
MIEDNFMIDNIKKQYSVRKPVEGILMCIMVLLGLNWIYDNTASEALSPQLKWFIWLGVSFLMTEMLRRMPALIKPNKKIAVIFKWIFSIVNYISVAGLLFIYLYFINKTLPNYIQHITTGFIFVFIGLNALLYIFGQHPLDKTNNV